ncbi:DNA helicase-2 / ATP-dependent DNA helicase PcrA [Hathewaya proteolytica DSM 3090]|uniref:ATP-dependent DNA helicase n=1 Tax=Hathewaya proteolytica DSM 3090 TaxID=1121331 RepID=A0A1M6NTS9_9CLOT|nr:DNA helicase PcrA [Hathewaya proteolytica]SHJ99129.1 DNA helicase-2 / ATP-dependent DNA helicase PcrA [Hathewaya proteolytica DSM 3090]
MNLKELLNKEQYEAAMTIEGPLLILAGAGSGKTRVLTYRIAHMLEDLDIRPYEILAITFTNKAAGEMRERVKKLVGEIADSMWISTFHSTCVRILRREIDKLNYSKNFTIYDSYDQKALLKQCMKELNINDKDISDKEIGSKISNCKNELESATQYKLRNQGDFRKSKIADVYLLYEKKLKANNALDFDDLIFKTVVLFKKFPDVLEFYQRKFRYIMIDEYQDTNSSQYELVKMLAEMHKNICVVGDDDQCIYEWRGANIQNILGFEKDFKGAKVVKLEQNYRSKGTILDAANGVIKNNAQRKDKVLRGTQEEGEKIGIYRAYSDRDEAAFVANKISELRKESEYKYRDMAILYRMNSQSRLFEESLRKNNIPYRIYGGLKFYDRKEIKDILAYLKVINNELDDISMQRIINVPKRSIGDTTVSKLLDYCNTTGECLYSSILDAAFIPGLSPRTVSTISKFSIMMTEFMEVKNTIPVSQLIINILETTGYLTELKKSKDPDDESRVENLKEFVSEAVEFENASDDKSLAAFLEKVTLVADVDNYDEEADSVVLMTIHSAKGLEFPVVFMVGMENGIFPSDACFSNLSEMEEARRLCYVAITRAKEKLYMTSAENRIVFGRPTSYTQSDFLCEIPQTLKIPLNEGSNREVNVFRRNRYEGQGYYKNNTTPNIEQNRENRIVKKSEQCEFVVGRKVRHAIFGIGTIVAVSTGDGDTFVTIAFDNKGVKKLSLTVAPLEVI